MRVGIVSRTVTYWPLYVLARAGEIELVELGATSAGVVALLAGTVDVAATCPDALITSGAPARIAGGLVDRPPTSLVGRSDIRDVAELHGRRIAQTVAQGSVSLFLRALLRERGVSDYEPVVVGSTPKQAAALERGEVDAAMLTFPFDERLVAQGFRRLARVGEALGPCAFTTLNVRAGWSRSSEWREFHDALAGAIGRLADPTGRRASLTILRRITGIRVDAAPDDLAYETRVDLGGLERLLGFMREEALGRRLQDARAYLDAGAVLR